MGSAGAPARPAPGAANGASGTGTSGTGTSGTGTGGSAGTTADTTATPDPTTPAAAGSGAVAPGDTGQAPTPYAGTTTAGSSHGYQAVLDARAEHRRRLEMLAGLLLALLVGILSSTVVSTALPRIIHDLDGTQAQYTWVVSSSLLAMTASTPLWGKLADLFSKKLLVQLAILIFVAGSTLCGLAQNTESLIGFRALQGLGMGGLQALVQVVIAVIIPPRERGRYMGYLGAVMAVSTVGGPLIGGVIVDTSWLGWRWCFYVGVPLAAIALVVLQKTLRVPLDKREVRIDYLGAVLIAGGVALLLVWTTLAGTHFDWFSPQSGYWFGGGLLALILAVVVEARTREPVVPLRLFRDRTTVLAVIASVAVGLAMFGTTVFLSQYFQLARAASPTEAGIMTLPMVGGILVGTTGSGRLITRYGRWKVFLVAGTLLLTGGVALAAETLAADTPYWQLAVFMAVVGLGVGMTMQNLVLAVQNTVPVRDLGAASSTVTFFRSLGGAIGVSVLGTVLSTRVANDLAAGLRELSEPAVAGGGVGDGGVPSLTGLPAPLREIVEFSYGDATAHTFLVAIPIAAVAFLAVLFIKEVPLRETIDLRSEPDAAAGGPGHAASAGQPPVPVPGVHGSVTRRQDDSALPLATMTLVDPAGRQLDRAVTDPGGGYRMGVPGPGTYLVVCTAPGHQPQVAPVTVAEHAVRHDFVLGGGTSVAGVVHLGSPAVGVPDVTMTLIDPNGDVAATTRTDGTGRYHLDSTSAGVHTLTAVGARFQPIATTLDLSPGDNDHDIALPAGSTLIGIVRSSTSARPVPEALVTVADDQGTAVAVMTTADDGGFVFDDLPQGAYTVTAAAYDPTTARVDLVAGQTNRTTLTLAPAHPPIGPEGN